MQRILSTILVAGFALSLIGCGERHGTVPVKVTITQKGSPLEGATVVVISSDGSGNTASAVTDASGMAALQTPAKGAGVLPGEYQVAVTKWVAGKTIPAPSEDDPQATTVERNNALPAKYATHATSGFTLTVSSKATEATFDIAE